MKIFVLTNVESAVVLPSFHVGSVIGTGVRIGVMQQFHNVIIIIVVKQLL